MTSMRPASVVCTRHGLRYDPEQAQGCSRCAAEQASTTRRKLLLLGIGGAVLGAAALAAKHLADSGLAGAPHAPASSAGAAPKAHALSYGAGREGFVYAPESASGPRPLLLLFDPSGRAGSIVRRYMPAAQRKGCIVAASTHVRNGSADDDDERELLSLLETLRSQYPVDAQRVYTAGFSGGGCGAYRLAIVRRDVVRGAIVECGHMGPWREVGGQARSDSAFYLFTRSTDMNRAATHELAGVMRAAGCRTELAEQPGGHTPMEGAEIDAALAFMLPA
jgi:poly(3-hydroxybutyrate) depolymerase